MWHLIDHCFYCRIFSGHSAIFLLSPHVSGLNQKLWPCYNIHWTQAAASLQPLSIKVQLVTPKPASENVLHQFIPESFPQQQSCVCVHVHIPVPCWSNCSCWPSWANSWLSSTTAPTNLNTTLWLIAWNYAAIADLQWSQPFLFSFAQSSTQMQEYNVVLQHGLPCANRI